jgi:leader peptidase (prepilin peptidase)/N-methyltransferase
MSQYLTIAVLLAAIPVLVYVSITDIRERRIPNKAMFPALAVTLLITLIRPERWSLLLGGVIMCGVILLPLFLGFGTATRKAVGGGDVKLALFVGLLLGAPAVFSALMVTFASATAFAIGGMMLGRITLRSNVAFAPFLSFGCMLAGTFVILGQLGI